MGKLLILSLCATLLLHGCTSSATESAPPTASAVESPSPPEGDGRSSVVGFYLDTVITLTAYDTDTATLNAALEKCGEYEALLSKTIEGSDVWNINHGDGQGVQVSDHTIKILETALEVSEASRGAFDVSIAPVVALWDFTGEHPRLPDPQDIENALPLVDYQNIQVQGNTVTIPPGHSIDLGAIAKGYIADEIADFCRDQGIEHAVLNFGGNVIAIGDKPDGSPWNVGIQNPFAQTGESIVVVQIKDSSSVTSGIYERGFDLDGVRYHHLLDPSTGWPAQNELAAISIFTESSMLADALSTACFVLGYEEALVLLEQFPGVEALFITRNAEILATHGAMDMIYQ